MPIQDRGAKIQAPSVRPSVDLAKLIELLADSILTEQDPSKDFDPRNRSLFLFSTDPKTRLRICTSAVLIRLFSHPKFKDAFKPSDSSGFVQNFDEPPFGFRAKLGGELSEGNPAKLPGHLDKLIAAVDQALDAALTNESDLSRLLLDNPAQQLQTLASSVGATFKNQVYQANLKPLTFDTSDRNDSAAVAKVLLAIEQVEADDCFGRMKEAIASRLEQRDYEEDDIDTAIDSLEAERDRADSQITRFLNFLDDTALSRVRLNVTFRIMETVAEQARSSTQRDHRYLVEYINRVLVLVEAVKASGLSIDLTAHYGQNADFDLATYLNQATFYSCLAVWPEWKTQIFEEKVSNKDSYGVQRGVSYRFRINGNNPEKAKPAFDARLDFINETLLAEDPLSVSSYSVCRRLAELIVLDAVIPKISGEAQEISTTTITQTVQARLVSLMAEGRLGIQTLIQDLRDRTEIMRAVSRALIKLLQDKGKKIVVQAQRRTAQQFICVKRSIVAWSRLEGAEPGVKDLLVSAQSQSQESVEWFNHIEISETPNVPQLLFSLKVTTELTEQNLILKGVDHQAMKARRLFPGQMLQVVWVPCESAKDKHYDLTPTANQARAWALSSSVLVEYELRTLTRRNGVQKGEADTQQWHAAAIAAFPVLIYCCLWRIIQRLRKDAVESPTNFTTLMLRLQQTGKNSNSEGEAYVYGAAQSIEALLAQDGPVRMQGITLDNLATTSAPYVNSGAFDALISAFPLALTTPSQPQVEKIGLISYSTRPCDEAPTLKGDNRSDLFFTQSYVASAIAQPFSGYELKSERTQSDIVRSEEEMQNQRIVREEIGHLRQLGCKHIILLSHAYGGRHLNRIADHNAPLTPVTFLEEVFQSFPDLTLYPLLRDVFPATRLRKRSPEEAAFEILKAGDHVNFLRNTAMERVRDIIPVYTFATLHVIDQEKRPQSGFCVYFLVSDQRVSNITWTERARQHLLDPEGDSLVHPCLTAVLRGLHFIEAERGVKRGQLIPVLDPFRWISPATREAAGEVEILHSRRRGRVHLSYPALLTHVSQTLHRRQP